MIFSQNLEHKNAINFIECLLVVFFFCDTIQGSSVFLCDRNVFFSIGINSHISVIFVGFCEIFNRNYEISILLARTEESSIQLTFVWKRLISVCFFLIKYKTNCSFISWQRNIRPSLDAVKFIESFSKNIINQNPMKFFGILLAAIVICSRSHLQKKKSEFNQVIRVNYNLIIG